MRSIITIKWNSDYQDSARFAFTYDLTNTNHSQFMDMLYEATNLKSELADFGATAETITLWNYIKDLLPTQRPHTALSVNDEIIIDNNHYVVSHVGFAPTAKVGA